MPVFHDVAQYSEEYDRLRLGIPTSSNFHKIITPQGKPSKQWREYACVLIAERILQHKIEFYNSPAMERGLIVEAEAADWYEFDQDVTVQRIGVITDEEHTMGCSPDRLVGDDGLLEIKAPLPHTQVEYWISGELSERFRPQLQGQLYVSQRSWVVSYAGMMCFQSWSSGLSRMKSLLRRSTASCGFSTTSSSESWRRSARRMNCRYLRADWRCVQRCAQALK
jgi:YqaJ-like viral recombinase domain